MYIHKFGAMQPILHGCHRQYLVWQNAVSQGLSCVPTTFDHHCCINSGFTADNLGPSWRVTPVAESLQFHSRAVWSNWQPVDHIQHKKTCDQAQ
jgi:hypothetical protein